EQQSHYIACLARVRSGNRPIGRKAFQKVKALITSNTVLAQYDEQLPLILTCDTSPHGVRCVLAHRLPCSREAPIAFQSRTLAVAERKYAHIDREALAIIVGVKNFHNYVFRRHVEIRKDHKPLLGLLENYSYTHKHVPAHDPLIMTMTIASSIVLV
ncbi:hypothetical protein D917_10373, partial [Trichinella nativa]